MLYTIDKFSQISICKVGFNYLINILFSAFKEMLSMPDNSPRPRNRPNRPEMLPRLQTDPRIRLSTHGDPLTPVNPLNPMVGGVPLLVPADSSNVSPCKDSKKEHKGFMTLGTRKRFQKALMKMNILPKNIIRCVFVDVIVGFISVYKILHS